MFKRFARWTHFCGLDLGYGSIKASLLRCKDEQNLDLLGVYETPALGLRDHAVSDLTELSETVRRAIDGVASKAMVKVERVYLGIGGELLTSRRSNALIPLIDTGTKVISAADVRKVIHQANLLGLGLEEEIIHDIPQYYKVDDINQALNPIGLLGRKLEVHTLLLAASGSRVRNITKAVHQAGFDVESVSFSSLCAADVVLEASQKQRGVVLMDVGSNMTNVLFFHEGHLADVQFIPWGGQYVTQSLSERLSLTTDLAEEIKKTHAVASQNNNSGEILIKREKGYMPVSRSAVCDAVNWEIENFLVHVETVIKGSVLYHQMTDGIVMAGAGGLLPGLMERIEGRTNLTVRMGVATKGLNNSSIFASSIGLAHRGMSRHNSRIIDLKSAAATKQKIWQRLNDLAQEYF